MNIEAMRKIDTNLTEVPRRLELLLKEQRNELCRQQKRAKRKRPRLN